jgi:hydrogenase maturation protease
VTDCVEPIGLLTLWEGAAAAWIVDAAGPPAALTGPEAAGTVHRTTLVGGEPFLETGVASTHGLGIAHAIRIGQALADLPPLVVIYTITVHQLSATTWIHPQIASAARTVARAIVAETLAYRPVRASITADGPRAGGWADQL